MRDIDIVGLVAAAWNCTPSATGEGTDRSGLRLSVIEGSDNRAHEAEAAAVAGIHTLCYPLSRYRSEVILDGRASAAKVIRPGELCFVGAGRQPWGVNFGPWRSLHLYVPDQLIASIIETEDVAHRPSAVEFVDPGGFRHPGIERACAALIGELDHSQPFARLRADALGLEVAIHLLRCYSNVAGLQVAIQRKAALSKRQVTRACEAMAARLDRGVELAQLASAAGYSPSYFSRAFKQATGLSPSAWLQAHRMDKARELLAHSGLAIADIAVAVGYAEQPQFTTAFLRSTGTTPGAWRKHRLT